MSFEAGDLSPSNYQKKAFEHSQISACRLNNKKQTFT